MRDASELESLHARLPITACEWLSESLLLAGEGPRLNCFRGHERVWQCRVLSRERVHRIVLRGSRALILGGKECALVEIQGCAGPTTDLSGQE